MTLRRAFHSYGERFALVPAIAVGAGASRLEVRGWGAVALLAPLFADPLDAMALRRLAAELTTATSPRSDREVLTLLSAAIDAGRLLVVRDGPRQSVVVQAPGPRQAPREAEDDLRVEPPVDATHWIEIRLVDDEDVGISGQRYLIIDPDGHAHRGYTDSLGSARISRLSPGTCHVSFPDLDGSVCGLVTAPADARPW